MIERLRHFAQDVLALNGLAESLKNAGLLDEALDRIKEGRKPEPFNHTFQTTEQEIEQVLGVVNDERA